MRTIYCRFLLLSACALLPGCASHAVQCDGRLQPINPPAAAAPAAPRRAP
jgi:outer membrane biogenesis lipoprotein LolB